MIVYYKTTTLMYKIIHTSVSTMKLCCASQGLTTLQGINLTNVNELDCSFNQLTDLPTLPNTLQMLKCTSNQLTNLNNLPITLKKLYCWYNPLTCLANLSISCPQLKELICYDTRLTCLEKLPTNLECLGCHGIFLT